MKLQLLTRHLSESVRHFLTLLLVAGTASATMFTMSGGKIRLPHGLEIWITTAGVALAAELTVVFIGRRLGRYDSLIRSAKRPDERTQLIADRERLQVWFYIIIGCSILANCVYRIWQNWPAHPSLWPCVGSVALALFVALVPLPLIIVLTIVVRPLPPDYAEQAREAYQRNLILMQQGAAYIMRRSMKRMLTGRLTDADRAAIAFASGVLGMHARPDERAQLEYAISQHTALLGAPEGGPVTVDAEVVEYITTRDIMDLYGVPERTAQEWARTCPGRNRRPGSRAWECPRSAIIRLHGQPVTVTSPVTARNRNRKRSASEAQTAANDPLATAEQPQEAANLALALVYAPLTGGEQTPQRI